MHNNYEILELFPTAVYATNIPNEFSKVVPWFYEQELANGMDNANYGHRSKNSYILDEPECVDLKNYILNNVKQYSQVLGYFYDEYKFSQSWISYKHPGEHHIAHTHPNSLISGVFYFGESEQNTSAIKFHKITAGVNTATIRPKTVSDQRNFKYIQSTFSIEFTPGLLILFPSDLTHSVPLNNTNKTRCSLAFNVVPTVGFGDEASLTELKF